MNNFSALNQHPHQFYESINSSVGNTVLNLAKENIVHLSSTSGPSAMGMAEISNQTSQTQSKYRTATNNSKAQHYSLADNSHPSNI